jgi:hypothetical protein
MEYGSMVHALEEIHRLLKPRGYLLDIHPVAEHSSIEIHRNGKFDLVGHLEVHQWCVDFEEADNALIEIVQRGIFTIEQKGIFDALTYYDSAAEMGTALKESIHKFVREGEPIDEEVSQVETLARQAEEVLGAASKGAKLVLREKDQISRLKPAEVRRRRIGKSRQDGKSRQNHWPPLWKSPSLVNASETTATSSHGMARRAPRLRRAIRRRSAKN